MASILFIDGKIVFDGGLIVFTADAENCECCAEGCFPDCRATPSNSPEVTGAVGSSFCTDANGTYSEDKSYQDLTTYHEWIWKKTPTGLPTEKMVLIVRCDVDTGEVAARIDYTGTDVDWGGSDSIWTGFKVITGVTCSGGNLAGTFSLNSLSFCAGSVSVTL